VWADNTDSTCDLLSVLTYLDNHASNRHHRTNATRSSPATNRSARRASNGAATPSSLPSPSSLPGLLSLPAMRPQLHLLIPQESLRASPLAQVTSSIASQGQDLSLSWVNCSIRSVLLSYAIIAYLE
jgi:hypothetical protein